MLRAPYPNKIDNMAFTLFAMEFEGDLDTRQGKIQQVIQRLAVAADPNDFATQCRVYDEVGIDSDTFTSDEIEYIQKGIERTWRGNI